ncbi:hypothetical protein QCB45_07630 [Thiomicrorhabdus sp. ZW0627]|uniref:hypothetical protein n=1 Tax=Thiomicrorhabdus sp. ZW0627 TaxID=3039774 RepID=UPI0024368A11|nr:hypothetical protein [Thiomicrorhabdus sp. ZW0627]MDG6774199.1 hypothetical protein [Thiomicrorhabdus sp. ZW0627]
MKRKTLSLLLLTALPSAQALAAPSGQPFTDMQQQIIEVQQAVAAVNTRVSELEQSVQAQIFNLYKEVDALKLRVDGVEGIIDTLEERVSANESLIGYLSARIDTLEAISNNLSSGASTLEEEIAKLQAENASLKAQVEAGYTGLQSQIDANSSLIVDLEVAMADNQYNLESLIANNTVLIQELQADITAANAEIATKQNIINGICPSGEAAISINPDGSIVCAGSAGGTGVGDIVTVYNRESLFGNYYYLNASNLPSDYPYHTIRATCPTGYHAVSGGHEALHYISLGGGLATSLYSTKPSNDGQAWDVKVRYNYTYSSSTNNYYWNYSGTSIAVCAK